MSAGEPEATPGTPSAGAEQSAALKAVLGCHSTPPPRRRQLLRLLLSVLFVLVAAVFFVVRDWLPATVLLLAAATLALPRRDRHRETVTEVDLKGIHVGSRKSQSTYSWADVREIYPRTAWADYSTLRTDDGTTVALPGVSDAVAELLERARADLHRRAEVR